MNEIHSVLEDLHHYYLRIGYPITEFRDAVRKLTPKFTLIAVFYGKDEEELRDIIKRYNSIPLEEKIEIRFPLQIGFKIPLGTWGEVGTAVIKSVEDFDRLVDRWGAINLGLYLDKIAVLDVDFDDDFDLDTYAVRTGRGTHYYFKVETEDDIKTAKSFKGILFRGECGEIRLKWREQVLIPPSLHPSGVRYEVKNAQKVRHLSEYISFFERFGRENKYEKYTLEEAIRTIERYIRYDMIPPCIKSCLEYESVHGGTHRRNIIVLFFFRSLGMSADEFASIFQAFKKDASPEITLYQARHWDSKHYRSFSCRSLQEEGFCKHCHLEGKIHSPMNYVHLTRSLKAVPCTEQYEDVPPSIYFPFERARKGQIQATVLLTDCLKCGTPTILRAATGSGKTAVFIAAARMCSHSVLIVEPHKGLQDQIRSYGIFVLKGRREYKCAHARSCDEGLCQHPLIQDVLFNRRSPEDLEEDLKVEYEKVLECRPNCEFLRALNQARSILREGGIVAINPGLLNLVHADRTIYDEFDRICDILSEPIVLRNARSEETALADEIEALNKEIERIRRNIPLPSQSIFGAELRKLRSIERKLDRLIFLRDLSAPIEPYVIVRRKDKFYVHPFPEAVATYLLRSGCVGVSATPPPVEAIFIEYEYSVATRMNAPIFYLPVCKLTTRESVLSDYENVRAAAQAISLLVKNEKFIVHCGNTKEHMQILAQILGEHFKVITHEKGQLAKTIEKFKNEHYDALLVAAADIGYDFDIPLQFVLKLPFPDPYDDEWRAIRAKYGAEFARDLYDRRCIDALVQMCGRVARSRERVGITIILDAKFAEFYNRNKDRFPKEFRERVVWLNEIDGTDEINKHSDDDKRCSFSSKQVNEDKTEKTEKTKRTKQLTWGSGEW